MMKLAKLVMVLMHAGLLACSPGQGTGPPPGGWANRAPTVVEHVVTRADVQLLEVSQGPVRTWVRVPGIGAQPGDYVLLGQGSLQRDIAIPETGERVPELVDIEHARVVDRTTAERVLRADAPPDAVRIGDLYGGLDDYVGDEVVVYGTAVRAPHAIGWYWVHLQDGSGASGEGTHDLTIKTATPVAVGQRVAFRGIVRSDVDLGFGYHYEALIEDGVPVP